MSAEDLDVLPGPAGWRPHPEHPTVERFWDGERFTGEHRFATIDPYGPVVREVPAPPRPASQIDRRAAGWLGGAALAAVLMGLAAIESDHQTTALVIAPGAALLAGGMLSRPLPFWIGGAFAYIFGYVYGNVVAVVEAHRHPCTGWFCFDVETIGILAGGFVATLGLLSWLAGRGLAWLSDI